MLFAFDRKNLVHPPETISAFVDTLIKRLVAEGLYYEGADRRSETRHVIALQVRAMPLDKGLRPAGEGLVLTTRDISRGGIALIHHERLECPYLGVEIEYPSGSSFQAAVGLLRCRPVGPYFELAGKFVTKVYDPIRKVSRS